MLNYRVLAAKSGREALEIFKKENIDLVISDLVMPEIGGLQLYETLREKDPDVKMVVISGYPIQDDGRDILEKRNILWVLKPPDLEMISSTVSKALSTECK